MEVYSILLRCSGKNAIPSFIWWYTSSLLVQFRGTRSNQRGSWYHMWSSSTSSKAQGSIASTWLLFANYDHWCSQIHKKVWGLSNSCGLYTPTSKTASSTVATRSFKVWGISVIGPFSPFSARCHRFILAITDYLSKWAKAVPLAEVKTTNVVNFIKHHVIHQFGFLRQIIYENGLQFASQSFYQFGDKYQVQNIASTAYKPTANGLAEVFNKTIIKLCKKFISASKWN